MTLQQLVRPNIWNLKPYSSARDEYKGFDARVFLDANESPYNSPFNRYPDPLQTEVKQQLSAIKQVPAEQIFLGNGSDEAIDLVYRVFCEPAVDNVVSITPTYGMYQVCADVNNVSYRAVPLVADERCGLRLDADALLAATDSHTKVVFLCTPNNPTGGCLEREQLMRILTDFKGIVVIDEAYADFMDEPSFLRILNDHPRLIVLQTFSKAWASAGIRLGMAFAGADIIELFNKVKYPYNVNILTQREAHRLLADFDSICQWVALIKEERTRLVAALRSLPTGEFVFPTDANFVLFRIPRAQAIYDYLLTQGIIVRNRSHIQLCNDCLRITVGTPEENDTLLQALRKFIG